MLFSYEKGYKNGGRVAVRLTVDEFKQKLEDYAGHSLDEEGALNDFAYNFFETCKDFKKIQSDAENWDAEGTEFGNPDICGIQELGNGLVYLGFCTGGDIEQPWYGIIYYDGKTLRGYIPENGNPWNTDCRCAFGCEEYTDKYDKYMAKVAAAGLALDEDLEIYTGYLKLFCELHGIEANDDEDYYDLDADVVFFNRDIKNRIIIK